MGLLLFDVLFVCSLPFVPKCTLFRLHDTAMSVNGTGIKGCFQRTELFIGHFRIACRVCLRGFYPETVCTGQCVYLARHAFGVALLQLLLITPPT